MGNRQLNFLADSSYFCTQLKELLTINDKQFFNGDIAVCASRIENSIANIVTNNSWKNVYADQDR